MSKINELMITNASNISSFMMEEFFAQSNQFEKEFNHENG